MTGLKLFQPHELVVNYFKSFGLNDDISLQKTARTFLTEHSDLKESDQIWNALDEMAYKVSLEMIGETHLSKTEQLGYFKMLCLSIDLKGVNIFDKLSKTRVQVLKDHFAACTFKAAPTTCQSIMIPQKIKVYKPLLPIKKWVKHVVKGKKYARNFK